MSEPEGDENYDQFLQEAIQDDAEYESDRDDDDDDEEEEVKEQAISPAPSSKPQKPTEDQIVTKSTENPTNKGRSKDDEQAKEDDLWENLIDEHGREDFELVYKIIDQFRNKRFSKENQAIIREQVKESLDKREVCEND